MSSVLLKRARVVVVTSISCSLVMGFLFGLICLRGDYSATTWVLAWLLGHLGPLYPLVAELLTPGMCMSLTSWLVPLPFSGVVVIGALAYLLHPAVWTRKVSVGAIIFWFFCGFGSIIMGIT